MRHGTAGWSSLAVARQARGPLVKQRLSPRTATMMAELEEKQYGDAASAKEWLIRAAHAPPDPAWTCSACGTQAADWAARCSACEGFDTIKWQQPLGTATLAVPMLAPPVVSQASAATPAPAAPANSAAPGS